MAEQPKPIETIQRPQNAGDQEGPPSTRSRAGQSR